MLLFRPSPLHCDVTVRISLPRVSQNAIVVGGLKRMASSMHCLHRRIHYERRLHRPSYYGNDDSSFGASGHHDRLHETTRRGHSLDIRWYEILGMYLLFARRLAVTSAMCIRLPRQGLVADHLDFADRIFHHQSIAHGECCFLCQKHVNPVDCLSSFLTGSQQS